MFSAAEQQTEGKPLSREHIREYLRLLFSETRFARFELEEVSYSLDRDRFVTGPRGLVGHNWETNLCWEVGLRHQPGGEIKMVYHARTTDSVR